MKPESSLHKRRNQILILVVVLSNVIGNVALGHGMHQTGAIVSASPLDYVRAFARPWTVIGVAVLAGWMISNLALLSRVPDFAWPRFFQVAKWALLAYLFTAAIIEYAFLRNHLKGGPLVILTLSLLVYAVQVPAMIAFTVARYDTSGGSGAEGSLAHGA